MIAYNTEKRRKKPYKGKTEGGGSPRIAVRLGITLQCSILIRLLFQYLPKKSLFFPSFLKWQGT
jgi:hypothetical protein